MLMTLNINLNYIQFEYKYFINGYRLRIQFGYIIQFIIN